MGQLIIIAKDKSRGSPPTQIGHFCLAPSVCLVVATNPIADAEENHYYLSPEGDLYLYVVPPEPQYRFLLCPLDRAQDESTNA